MTAIYIIAGVYIAGAAFFGALTFIIEMIDNMAGRGDNAPLNKIARDALWAALVWPVGVYQLFDIWRKP